MAYKTIQITNKDLHNREIRRTLSIQSPNFQYDDIT